jgi:uncharacterized protein DUF3147
MKEIVVRFLIGGLAVSFFSVLGDVFKPKSFAGLFGAAPSVALATLGIAIVKDGRQFAATEAHSMIAGSIALFVYTSAVSWILMRRSVSALWVATTCLMLWAAVAFSGWYLWLR